MIPSQLTAAWLREHKALPHGVIPLPANLAPMLADALDEADDSFRSQIELECREIHGWYNINTAEIGVVNISKALAYLEKRGLIERKAGEPHLVRFVDAPKVEG
jgi:hypothetical protein